MPNNRYFSIEKDKEVIDTGGFWCLSCLIGKPIDDQSPDPRYCLECYDFLSKEAELLPITKRPRWTPKTPRIAGKKTIQVSQDTVSIMATVKSEKSEVAIIQPPVAKDSRKKRGPKHKALPVELIAQWAGDGMGYKRIATKLKAEHGIDVGFRTVARIVVGHRVLV